MDKILKKTHRKVFEHRRVTDNEEALGTQEDREKYASAFEKVVIKILNYADRKEPITKEEYEDIVKFYTFFCGGIKKRHLCYTNRDVPITSADALYILARGHRDSTRLLAQRLGVSHQLIAEIQRGDHPLYKFEYDLFKRITGIIRKNIKSSIGGVPTINMYMLFEVTECSKGFHKDFIALSTTKRRLEKLRYDLIVKKFNESEYNKMVGDLTIDIRYPIEIVDIIKDHKTALSRQ